MKKKVSSAQSRNNPTKKRHPFPPAQRLADLAAFVADSLSAPDLDQAHREVWERRVAAALVALNGVDDAQGQRRLVREAFEMVGGGGVERNGGKRHSPRDLYVGEDGQILEGPEAFAREKRRLLQAIEHVRDADPELAKKLERSDHALLVNLLRAFNRGTGRPKSGDSSPRVKEVLRELYKALDLERHERFFNDRAPNELP